MKMIYTLFHFLGSVYFAILLIGTLALYVIGGTLLEGWSSSHLYAAQYTYSHPLFSLLLGFFFINILFSALRRWPFKKKHIPFLITHLGLLMVLSGVLIKNGYGTQGIMQISEGSASQQLLIPNSHALKIENKEHVIYQFPPEKIDELKIKIIGYVSHVKEKWHTFIKDQAAYIMGLPLIPLHKWQKEEPWPASESAELSDGNTWHILALHTPHTDSALKRAFLDFEKRPLLLLIHDHEGDTSLWTLQGYDAVYKQSMRQQDLTSLVVYDHGFGGYGIQAHVPFSQENALPMPLPSPLKIFSKACEKQGCPYVDTLLKFIESPLELPTAPLHDEVLLKIDWSTLPAHEFQGCFWGALLIKQLLPVLTNHSSLISYLQEKKWPLEIPKSDQASEILIALVQQIFSSAAQLPSHNSTAPSNALERALWMKTYLLAYGLHEDFLLPLIQNEIGEKSFILESTLNPHYQSAIPSIKLEDNRPGLRLKLSHGDDQEVLDLAYDATGSGLRWPALKGKFLFRFQPAWQEIPYRVRLRQARQINYSHSQQPYSYESDVLINGEEVTLSMNRVHQTWDGYRFYMSGMTTSQDNLKTVQIVVNHDPVKYFLTYPGGGVVGLGIVLLFWGRKTTRKKSRS